MRKEEFCEVLGDLNENYVKEAHTSNKKSRKHIRTKWRVVAAGICLIVTGGLLYNLSKPTDFSSVLEREEMESALVFTMVDIEDRVAHYAQVTIDPEKLKEYIGVQYRKEEGRTWYYVEGFHNLKYLIEESSNGTLALWRFIFFDMDKGETYTYGDILKTIYNVDSAEDIVSITASPTEFYNTDLGKAIKKEIGIHTYTEEEDIATFYDIAKNVICYGIDSESKADNQRFTYSFSAEDEEEYELYGERGLSIKLIDGTTIDSWKYVALSGTFFEYGGPFTEPLAEEQVYALNEIFGIK